MRQRKPWLLDLYVAAVAGGGIGTIVAIASPLRLEEISRGPTQFAVLAALVVVAELTPIRFGGKGQDHGLLASATFSFALLLAYGTAPAVLTQAAASLVADIGLGKDWRRTSFNVGQFTLSLTLAGLVYRSVAAVPLLTTAPRVAPRDLLALVVAAVVFFFVNNGLIGIVVALSRSLPLFDNLRWTVAHEAGSHFVILGLAPIVAVVAERSVPLIALLLLPVLAVYRSARIAQEKEHQAWHDSLTNLPNRLLFQDRVEQAL